MKKKFLYSIGSIATIVSPITATFSMAAKDGSDSSISFWKDLKKNKDGSYNVSWETHGDKYTYDEVQRAGKIYESTDEQYVDIDSMKHSDEVGYEIFIRSFADSNGDGIGDFRGIANKVGYLKDLGITRVWMMPWMPAPSLHKYDTLDYYKVDPEYGTMKDFKYMIKTLSNNGIKVDVDLAFNHTSKYNSWFKDFIHDVRNPNNTGNVDRSNWYRFLSNEPKNNKGELLRGWHSMPDQKGGYYFAAFGESMPDLNLSNSQVKNELIRIVDYWKRLGVSGIRLDAPKEAFDYSIGVEIPGMTYNDSVKWNNNFWKGFTSTVEENWPRTYIVGENWSTTSEEMKNLIEPFSEFSFTWKNKVINMINRGTVYDNSNHLRESNVEYQFQTDIDYFKQDNPNFLATNFLSNHDRPRIRNALNITSGHNEYRAFVAANMLMALPGMPMLYYGDEIMMNGYDDGVKFSDSKDTMFRLSMPWGKNDSSTTSWVNNKKLGSPETYYDTYQEYTVNDMKEKENSGKYSLLEHYKKLIAFRKRHGEIFQNATMAGRVLGHYTQYGSGSYSDFTANTDTIFGLNYQISDSLYEGQMKYIVLVNLKDGWSSKVGGNYVYDSFGTVELIDHVGEIYNNLSETKNRKFSMGPKSIALFRVYN